MITSVIGQATPTSSTTGNERRGGGYMRWPDVGF
jgi:hypothetical protein